MQSFPGLEVLGSTYPVPRYKEWLSNMVGAVQLAGLLFVILGERLFRALNIPTPEFYGQIAQSKFAACMGVWFIGNLLRNNLVSTGAFEVYFDGNLIFSKLQAGRLPTVAELMQQVAARIEASSS